MHKAGALYYLPLISLRAAQILGHRVSSCAPVVNRRSRRVANPFYPFYGVEGQYVGTNPLKTSDDQEFVQLADGRPTLNPKAKNRLFDAIKSFFSAGNSEMHTYIEV
jgi:hypothetical protein